MNSFSHFLPFLDQPYFAVGCSVPDILGACDRRCRVREKRAAAFLDDSDEVLRLVARGVVQHHQDDAWFHRSARFNNLNMKYAIEFRDTFGNDHSMRPSLIGHIIIEIFLDWFLEKRMPGSVERFYEAFASVDPKRVQNAINHFATKPTNKLAPAIEYFVKERFVFDYATDEGVRYRMNKVLTRVKLVPMPESSVEWLGGVRREVEASAEALLAGFALPIERVDN